MHTIEQVTLSSTPFGWILLTLFVIGYYFIAMEEKYGIDKAKPALFMGTLMFVMIGLYYVAQGYNVTPFEEAIDHLILEIAEIFFFLFVAMTYVEALIERGVFSALRAKLIAKVYSYRELFWITGILAFFISSVADNLTTALILSTVLLTIDSKTKPFLLPKGCMSSAKRRVRGCMEPIDWRVIHF
jgi:Na+/H+ antiporter NhaD/arsenite permease-like protein